MKANVAGVSGGSRKTGSAAVRDVLAVRGDVDARDARPACYSGVGFTDDLRREAEGGRVLLVGLDELYAMPGVGLA